jgi:excisionase family DNA binding protein
MISRFKIFAQLHGDNLDVNFRFSCSFFFSGSRIITAAVLNVSAACEAQSCRASLRSGSRKSIERMVARGVLTPIRIGRNWRFNRADVIETLSRVA